MNDLISLISEKSECIIRNSNICFCLLGMFFLFDITTIIVYKKTFIQFFLDGNQFDFSINSFIFLMLFFMILFILHFISNIFRIIMKSLFADFANHLAQNLTLKNNSRITYSLYGLKSYSITTKNIPLYNEICQQEKMAKRLKEKLEIDFFLGILFISDLCINNIFQTNSFLFGLSAIKNINKFCYYLTILFLFFLFILLMLRFFYSFLSYAEYYSTHIECEEYDNYLKSKREENSKNNR